MEQDKLKEIIGNGTTTDTTYEYTKPVTMLQRGLAHFVKAFAWYVAVLVAIVGVALGVGTVLDIDVTSRAFVLDTALFLGGTILVYVSFMIDGIQEGKRSEEYTSAVKNYKQARVGKSIDIVQEYIDTRKNPSIYPSASRILYALGEKVTKQNKINLNASKHYLYKQGVLKVVSSMVMALVMGSVVVNLTEQNVAQIIFSIVLTLIGIGASIVTGKRSGYTSITVYQASILEYLTDLLNEIKEGACNAKI